MVQSIENNEALYRNNVVDFPLNTIHHHSELNSQWEMTAPSINQLKYKRQTKSLLIENEVLTELCRQRFEALKDELSCDPSRAEALNQIEAIDQMINSIAIDSMDAQMLNYRKNMIAYYYSIPAEYIQLDSATRNIQAFNVTIQYLVRVISVCAPDADNARLHEGRLHEMLNTKLQMYQQLLTYDRVVQNTPAFQSLFAVFIEQTQQMLIQN